MRSSIVSHRRRRLLMGLAEFDDVAAAGQSTFVADDYDIASNSSATAAFTITARNQFGQPVPGLTATIAMESIAVSAANSSVSAAPGTIADDGVESCLVTITVRDASNRGIPNIPAADVQIAVSGSSNSITQPTQPTDASGRTTASFTSTAAATKTVSATAGPLATAITQTQSVVVSGTPVAGGRANEPAGFSVISEWNDDAMPAGSPGVNGFVLDGPTTWGNKSLVSSGYGDPPTIGGTDVILTHQDAGVDGGFDPQRIEYHGLSGHGTELYISVESKWERGDLLSTAPGGGKQYILWFTSGGRYVMNADAVLAGGNWTIFPTSDTDSDIPTSAAPVIGEFVELEWYFDRATGSADGTIRAYQAGTQILEATGLTFPAGDFDYFTVIHANNGNRPVTGASPEVRVIATPGPGGAEVDANVWDAAIYLSRP